MDIKRFEEGVGIPIEEFLDIITHGFYFIKDKEIYWCGERAIFIGNGYCPHSNNMIVTYPCRGCKDVNVFENAHFFSWDKEESTFNFENYNKTWSIHREVLEENLKNDSIRIKK